MDTHFGFRSGQGTLDALFTWKILHEKMLDKGRKLHNCFVDLKKAFGLCHWSSCRKSPQSLEYHAHLSS